MRRLAWAGLAAALIGSLTAGAPAVADSGIYVSIGVNGIGETHSVSSNIKVSGAVTVDFHGDAASNCAEAHLCGVNGAVRWDPSGDGSIFAIGYRAGGHHFEDGFLSIGDFSSEDQPLRTSARVHLGDPAGGLCVDGASGDLSGGSGSEQRGSSVEVRMLNLPGTSSGSGDVLRTSCAGPMESDVAALLPARHISERGLVRGHRTLDFTADKTFATHGLAGTLHSTVLVRVLGGSRDKGGGNHGPSSARTRRIRTTEVGYRLERVSGQVSTHVTGRTDPDLCRPLDACGIAGSVITTPVAASGNAYLTASGPAKRVSRKELRAALGLAAGRVARPVSREGYMSWGKDLGSITSDLSRLGTPVCSDSQSLAGGGSINLDFAGRRVRATYDAGSLDNSDRLRTRCPGPGADDVSGALASGTFPLGLFGHRRVVLRLTRGRRFGSAGYGARVTSDLTVVLRRTSVHESTYREEIPTDFEQGHTHSLR